ncbi:unnamed protein product [Ascophyllum nodosum]
MAWHASFVALVAILSRCSAWVVTTSFAEKNDVSALLIAKDFGVAAGGFINFDVKISKTFSSPPYYLVVVGDRTNGKWFDHVLTLSPDEYGPAAICVAPSTARFEVTESGSFNFSVAQYDLYNAYLLVCHQGELYGGGEVTSTFINLDPEGRLTQHLSIQLSMLPSLYMLMAAVYVGFAVAWVVEIARLRLTAHLRQHVLPVHYLCLAVILVKMIDALVRATYFHRQSKEGQNQGKLSTAEVFCGDIYRVVFMFTLLLISLGWGFIRPSLRLKESWLVSVTIGFYACVSLLQSRCDTYEVAWCNKIGLMEYAIRSLIMLTTVVAINFNISHIRFCIQLPWTSSSALEYLKLSRYLSLRMTFLAYLLLPTVLIVVNSTLLSWEYQWIHLGMEEFITMIILANLGLIFAPFDPWLLTRAFDHSLEQENS